MAAIVFIGVLPFLTGAEWGMTFRVLGMTQKNPIETKQQEMSHSLRKFWSRLSRRGADLRDGGAKPTAAALVQSLNLLAHAWPLPGHAARVSACG